MTKKDIKTGGLLPDGITIESLQEYWNMMNREYAPIRRILRLLDAANRGKLWDALNIKAPDYQVFTETNHVNDIVKSLSNSVYSVGKEASVIPRCEEEVEDAKVINQVLGRIWYHTQAFKYQRKAGANAALFNIGITQVGWKNAIVGGNTTKKHKGETIFKNINPLQFGKDPYASEDDNCKFMMTWDDYHISTLKSMSIYKTRLEELVKAYGDKLKTEGAELSHQPLDSRAKTNKGEADYHKVVSYWVRKDNGKLCEIHLLNNEYVLYVNDDLFLDKFPFAILYCNEPGNDVIGVSEPAKILKNTIAYNMILSIIATYIYRAQRPPRFLNVASGINVREFSKYGADADKTWLVNGDASQAIHYAEFPTLPPMSAELPVQLNRDILDKSQIDEKYKGKDFGSVTTTGGTDNVINQSNLSDTTIIQNFEDYSSRMTELVVTFYLKYGDDRQYGVKDKLSGEVKNVPINFKELASNLMFDYEVNVTSELPKSKMRLAQAANILLEKQAQYNANPALITQEEWLLMQDIPFKDLIYNRIKTERSANTTEEVTQILFEFAALIEQGIEPNQALQQVIDSLEQQKDPQQVQEKTVDPGSAQASQQVQGKTVDPGSAQASQQGRQAPGNVAGAESFTDEYI